MRALSQSLAVALVIGLLGPSLAHGQAVDAPVGGGKAIRAPAEAAAYAAALGLAEAAPQAAALEAFVRSYPSSVVRLDALQQAMADYQVLNDPSAAEQTAQRILQTAPEDPRALAIEVLVQRTRARGANVDARVAASGKAAADAGRGLKSLAAWPGPEGMAAEAAAAMKGKLESIFYGALAYDRLTRSDFTVAKYYYLKAVGTNPNDVQTDYELSIAELAGAQADPEGFWWAAKAYALAGEAGAAASQAAIEANAKARYIAYHGGDDGWQDIVLLARSENAPPDGFTVAAAAPPAELAVQAVRDNDPSTFTVPDWEFVLTYRDASPANRDAADKVWAAILSAQDGGATRLKLPVLVLSTSRNALEAAITDESRKAGRADLHVILAAPLAQPPAPGTTVQVTGLISTYATQPFAFTMRNAEIIRE